MTKDGKISILIDVDAKQVPNVISSIEKNFGQLGKNADDITKKLVIIWVPILRQERKLLIKQ